MEMELAVLRSRCRSQQTWDDGKRRPHGGYLETAVKLGFAVLVMVLVGVKITNQETYRSPEPAMKPEVRAEILAKAKLVRDTFMARGGGWKTIEAVAARNDLIDLRETLARDDDAGRERVGSYVAMIVDASFEERRLAIERAGDVQAQHKAMAANWELTQAYQMTAPKSMTRIGKGGLLTKALAWLGLTTFKLYLLFIPFAFLVFLARLRRFGYSIGDELVFGWRNLLLSAAAWPFGLADYPKDTALAIRRRRIEAEYRARVGKTGWRDELSAADRRKVEELVLAPRVELAARLAAIGDLPATVLWRARLAAYSAMIVGALLTSLSAQAQTRGGSPAAAETTAEVADPPLLELHGFSHIEAGAPNRPLTLARALLIGEAHPHPAMTARIATNLVGAEGRPVLLDALASVAPEGSPFSLRLGQLAGRAVFMAPAPNQERIIGGPAATALMSFWDIGIEVAGQHGPFGWALEVLSGSGMNTPDANVDKDVMGSATFGPFGPLRFALAFQAGNQPDGFRTRGAVNAVGEFGPVIVNLLGTHQLSAGSESWIASSMVGWRIHECLDLAAGYDELHLAESPTDRVVRAQPTVHLVGDHLKIGTAYRWSRSDGHGALGRLELNF